MHCYSYGNQLRQISSKLPALVRGFPRMSVTHSRLWILTCRAQGRGSQAKMLKLSRARPFIYIYFFCFSVGIASPISVNFSRLKRTYSGHSRQNLQFSGPLLFNFKQSVCNGRNAIWVVCPFSYFSSRELQNHKTPNEPPLILHFLHKIFVSHVSLRPVCLVAARTHIGHNAYNDLFTPLFRREATIYGLMHNAINVVFSVLIAVHRQGGK